MLGECEWFGVVAPFLFDKKYMKNIWKYMWGC